MQPPKDTTPQPHRVLRALWFEGKVRKVGDVIHLPRLLAAELRAADKVEPAPAKPEGRKKGDELEAT